jgi:hypothetical protein
MYLSADDRADGRDGERGCTDRDRVECVWDGDDHGGECGHDLDGDVQQSLLRRPDERDVFGFATDSDVVSEFADRPAAERCTTIAVRQQ